MPEILTESFDAEWEALVRLWPRAVAALVVVVVLWLVGRGVGFGVARVLEQRKGARTHVAFFRRLTVAVFIVAGVALGLGIVGLQGVAAALLASGGLVTVVAAFAFREIGENLLAGLFLAFSCPFEVGNVIRSGSFEGVVRAVELRYTHIRTADGCDVYLPNAQIFNEPVENLTRDGLRRAECRVGIDYADDADTALELLLAEVRAVEGVLADPAPSAAVAGLADQHVELSVFVWVDVFKTKRTVRDVVGECRARTRRALLAAGFTVSSGVSTAVDLRCMTPLEVRTGTD